MPRPRGGIRIPRTVLRVHLTDLLNGILLDEQEAQHIDKPPKLTGRPFRDAKYPVVAGDEHAAFLLALDFAARHPGQIDPSTMVGASEWDLSEFAGPMIIEWRKRWSVSLPTHWLDAVEWTDESPAEWRARRAARVDLPPDLGLPGLDLRHALGAMGWRRSGHEDGWQRLRGVREPFDVLVPADEVLAHPAMIRLAIAWYAGSVAALSEAPEAAEVEDIERLCAEWQSAGIGQVADALRLVDSSTEPDYKSNRLQIAAEQLEYELQRSSED